MSTVHLVAKSTKHPTVDLTIEVLQRSTSTSLSTTVSTIYEWLTTVDIDLTVDPQILAAKDLEVRITPSIITDPGVHLYQLILTANKIWRLSSTISDDYGFDVEGFLPKKVIMTATSSMELGVSGALDLPRAMLFASIEDAIEVEPAVVSLREILVSATAEDEYVMGEQGFTA